MDQRTHGKFDLGLLVACGDLECFDRMQADPVTIAACVECYRRQMGLESSEKAIPARLLPRMIAGD